MNSRTLQTSNVSGDSVQSSVQTNFSTPGTQDNVPSESANNAMPSPKATPVNQGPPRPKPRITLLRYVGFTDYFVTTVTFINMKKTAGHTKRCRS